MKRIKQHFPVILLTIFCIWSIIPLLHPGFFVTDDGEWIIIRLSAFHQALASGQFPVRWLGRLDFAYGYPVANFLYPGVLYLGELIHLFHISFVNSTKILIGISLLGSGVCSFLWLKKFFTPIIACMGALFFLFSPYHLYDIYTRGSIGEAVALFVVVFVLWQIERKSVLFSATGIGFLILSHNTLAAFFLPVIGIYYFLRKNELNLSWKEIALPYLLGIGCATFFWLPALYDLQYTVFSKTIISNWQSYFAAFWLIQPFVVGIIISAIFIIQDRGNFRREILPLFFLGITAIPLFFSTSLSSIFWTWLPISFIQFPFRLLSVSLLGGAFLSCYLLSHSKKSLPFWIIFTLITLVLSGVPFVSPKVYTDKGEGFYTTNEDTTTVQQEYMPIWVKEKPFQHPPYPLSASNNAIVLETGRVNSKRAEATIATDGPAIITFEQHYFPGWTAYIDGKPVPIHIATNTGVMQVSTTSGNHTVVFKFVETPMRLFADMVSLVSLFGIGVASILLAKKKGWKYL
jgi:hypothetical protein